MESLVAWNSDVAPSGDGGAPARRDEAADAAHAADDHGDGHRAHLGRAGANTEPAQVKGDLAIFSAVVFLLLVIILRKFAWGLIAAALEKREHHIADKKSPEPRRPTTKRRPFWPTTRRSSTRRSWKFAEFWTKHNATPRTPSKRPWRKPARKRRPKALMSCATSRPQRHSEMRREFAVRRRGSGVGLGR